MNVTRIVAAAFFLLSASMPARAQFEGVAEFRLSTTTGRGETIPGHGTLSLSKEAVRMEWEMDLRAAGVEKKNPRMPEKYRTTIIQRISEPDKTYMLNDEKKVYTVIDVAKAHESAGTRENFIVKKLGRDTVAGLSCEKALVTSPSGTESEFCVTRELVPSNAWLAAMSRRDRSNPMGALRSNGLDGFPIRMITREARDKRVSSTFELVRFEKRPVPSSLFQIPSGYKESSSASVLMTPEQEKAMKDAMDKMTPEQRKRYEEMMKKRREK